MRVLLINYWHIWRDIMMLVNYGTRVTVCLSRYWCLGVLIEKYGLGGFIKTHWGRVTHTCVGKLAIFASDNSFSPERRQAIIWTKAGILSIGPLGTHFSEILVGIQALSIKKMHLKMSSAKWRPFCLGLNMLTSHGVLIPQACRTIPADGQSRLVCHVFHCSGNIFDTRNKIKV